MRKAQKSKKKAAKVVQSSVRPNLLEVTTSSIEEAPEVTRSSIKNPPVVTKSCTKNLPATTKSPVGTLASQPPVKKPPVVTQSSTKTLPATTKSSVDSLASRPAIEKPPEPTAAERFANRSMRPRRPRLHLVLGDSIAHRADIASRYHGDSVLNLAREQRETWASLLERLPDALVTWRTVAEAKGVMRGTAIVWLTGDDVYSGPEGSSKFDAEVLDPAVEAATVVIIEIQQWAEDILIFGPIARLAGETFGCPWERTAAYHMERSLAKLGLGVRVVYMGRNLTRKMGRKRHGLKGNDHWYLPDRVHLSAEGYAKLADSFLFPIWLTLKAAN